MSLQYHRVPPDLFRALAAGGGGPDAVSALANAQYSKHALLLWGVVRTAQTVGHDQSSLARRGYDLLDAAQRHDPSATGAVIGHPSVGAWALRTLRALRSGPVEMPGAEPGGLCSVAAAAAIRAKLPAEIEVPGNGGAVVLPSLGAAMADGGSAMVRSTANDAEVASASGRVVLPGDPHQYAPGWQPLRRLRAGPCEVLIDDLDPFRMPALTDVAPRLSDAAAERWRVAFGHAWRLLARHHPATAMEVAGTIKVFVPLPAPARGQVTSSSSEAFGAIALSELSDPCTFAVTLAHELQHQKLSALIDTVSLTLPDDGRWFYAPWREDPRPVSGLLQGAYAYLGVTAFWRRQRYVEDGADGIRAHAQYARWRAATTRAVDTLRSSGHLTAAGLDFVHGMARTLSTWEEEAVPSEAHAMASRKALQHLARWQSNNGPVPAG